MTHSKRMAEAEIDALVSPAVKWNVEKCAQWLDEVGLPQYKECFTVNFITGRKLVLLDINHLVRLGITDFDHLKIISAALRELLHLPEPQHLRSLSLPHTDPIGIYMERRSRTGASVDTLTYSHFLKRDDKFLTHCYGCKINPFN